MEKPAGLADLKLVNKYYPVANYSYPSPKMEQSDRMRDRSSVDSEASVPGMVDDRESIISIEEDDRDQYHISGAELWDSFWEDPFWEANAQEASHETDSITRKIIHRNTSYPALLPSPDVNHRKDHYFAAQRRNEDMIIQNGPATTWPLIAAELPVTPRPVTPKASYSLFPRTASTPLANPVPRAPNTSPEAVPLMETPRRKNTVSLPSMNRTSKPNKLLIQGVYAAERTSWTQSAPVTPVVIGPTPSVASDLSERSDSALSFTPRQHPPTSLIRARSETVVSCSSGRSIPYSIGSSNISQHDLVTPPTIPSRPQTIELPRTRLSQYSQAELAKLYPPITQVQPQPQPQQQQQQQWFRMTTEINHLPGLRQRRSQASILSHVETTMPVMTATTVPSTPAAMMPPPTTTPITMLGPPSCIMPMPVSVFEDDSDSETESESFARRIARSFTSTKRTRSAGAAPRSRRGNEVAKDQLRRARAGTLSSSSAGDVIGARVHVPVREERDGDRSMRTTNTKEDGKLLHVSHPILRRQKSEVLGKILWGRR